MINRFVCSLALVAMTTLAACAKATDDAGPPRGRSLSYRTDLRIGDDVSNENTTFARIDGLALAPDGRVLAADAEAHIIKVFDPNGQYLFDIGRSGAGPGATSA